MGLNNVGGCQAYIPPGWYKHFKGALYYVISSGRHSETNEQVVVYMDSLNRTWVRPLEMFKQTVKDQETGKDVPRYAHLDCPTSFDMNTLPAQDLSVSMVRVCRSAIEHSYDTLDRYIMKLGSPTVPYALIYTNPISRHTTCLNSNHIAGSKVVSKVPYTLVYEFFQTKKGKRSDLWRSFSNRIERR